MRYFSEKYYEKVWEEANRPYHTRNIPLTTENIMRFARLLEKKVMAKQFVESLRSIDA